MPTTTEQPTRTILDERHLVVLSTAHLRKETVDAANAFARDEAATAGHESHVINRVAYGYLFPVYGYPYSSDEETLEDLEACANYVGEKLNNGEASSGCYYILFDCDGFVMEGLPTYV